MMVVVNTLLAPGWLFAYLLILGSLLDEVGHHYWKKLGYSIHTSSICAISRCIGDGLAGLASVIYPLSGYRVYDVKNAQFMSGRCLLKVCVDLLDEDRFRLGEDERLALVCGASLCVI